MVRIRPTTLPALLLVFGAACSEGALPDTVTRTDSAGISIVTTLIPQWSEATGWFIAPVPRLSIREVEGLSATHFYYVTAGVMLDDGRIVVANAGTAEVQIFSSAGMHLRTLGRRGEGPGEFDWIESIQLLDDGRLFVYDDHLGRGTVYDPDGDLSHTVPVLVPPGIPASDAAVLSTGELLAVRAGPNPDRGESVAAGLVTGDAVFVRLSQDGSTLDTVAVAPGDELFLLRSRSGGPAGFRVPLFGLSRAAVVYDDRLYTRFGRGSEIAEYDMAGRLLRVIRWNRGDLTITPAARDSALRALFSDDEGAVARYDLPVPETRPGFGRLIFDSDGNLWASDYAQYLQDPKRWFVFDTLGWYLGDVTVPDRFRILDIKGDRVLGRSKDMLDRETVQVLELERR